MATVPHQARVELTRVTPEGVDDFLTAVSRGFQDDYDADAMQLAHAVLEPDRSFGFTVDGRWVATCLAYSRVLTVPGGSVPVAAVSDVTVHPSYRRQGLLTQMMTHQLEGLARDGEPVALLWASEALIYGRFGYGGVTAKLRLTGDTRETAFRPEVDLGRGSVGEVTPAEFRAVAVPLHARLLPERPGALDRPAGWWDAILDDRPVRHRGETCYRFVVHYDEAGQADGYLAYRLGEREGDGPGPGLRVRVVTLEAVTAAGYARLWRFVLDLDLVRTVEAQVAVDEPIRHLVQDPRSLTATLTDATYARLVDVPTALAARVYACAVDLVLDVRDTRLPHNHATFRLQGGPEGAIVTRVADPPDVELDVRELGSLYLGGTSAATLHRAGLLTERTPGAVATLSAAFGWTRQPFCLDFF